MDNDDAMKNERCLIKKIIKIGWKALGDFKQLKMDIESKNE